MELVKHSPEEQAAIDRDRALPHCAVAIFAPLTRMGLFQETVASGLEDCMVEVKRRADAAKMQVLSTSISTNSLEIDNVPFLSVLVLCQWLTIEQLETMQRRQFLAGTPPGRGA